VVEVGTSGSAGFLGVPDASSVQSLPNLVWSTTSTGDLLIEQTGGSLNQGQYEVTITFNNTKTTDADVKTIDIDGQTNGIDAQTNGIEGRYKGNRQ
jgi:hypothetical protein